MAENEGRVPGEEYGRAQEMVAGSTDHVGHAIVEANLAAGTLTIGKLGANSGVDIGDVTVNNVVGNPVPVDDAEVGEVDDAAVTNPANDATMIAALKGLLTLMAGDLSAKPFAAMLESGLTELIGINEQVDQDDYSGSVGVALGATMSGEILMVTLYSTEDGSGAVQEPDGVLLFLDADPEIAVGDTAMTAAERVTVIGQIDVETTDWQSDANGASACIKTQPLTFHALSTIYVVWFHENATSFNDAGGDDEQLEARIWFRRDS